MSADQERTGTGGRPPREIVSFVRRGSRLGTREQAAWERSAQRWVLDLPQGERETIPAPQSRLDLTDLFGRHAPVIVEIGSGQGENIASAAARSPERDHLAFEVYRPGLAHTLLHLERLGSPSNIRLLPFDAQKALPTLMPPASIDEVWIFFPDPWHKSRHRKRRLLSDRLLDSLLPLMRGNGILRTATDWPDYAAHMREVLDNRVDLASLHPQGAAPQGAESIIREQGLAESGWAPRFEERVLTSFERKAHEAGRIIWDMAYRVKTPAATGKGGTP